MGDLSEKTAAKNELLEFHKKNFEFRCKTQNV